MATRDPKGGRLHEAGWARSNAVARPRIAVGTVEISGCSDLLAEGFQRLGYEATTAMRLGQSTFDDARYDLDIARDVEAVDLPALQRAVAAGEPRNAPWRRHPSRRPGHAASPLSRLTWLVERHDVFVFVYGSLYPDRRVRPARAGIGREYAWLRSIGKRIVSVFVGPDVRHAASYDQQQIALGSGAWPLGRIVPTWGTAPLVTPLRNLRRGELYSDVVLSNPEQSGLALRPYTHFFVPVALDRYQPRIPGREVPRVVHAPSHTAVKGTREILAALERLRRRGVAFELEVLNDRPHREVLERLADADVVVDQLHLPFHGALACEAWASGAALATCNDERFVAFPPERPIVHIDPHNIESQLARLLTDRALRRSLAEAGLRHVRTWHAQEAVAQRIVDALGPGGPPIDHRPEFFARNFTPGRRWALSESLKELNRRVVARYGLPDGITPSDLARRGLLPRDAATRARAA